MWDIHFLLPLDTESLKAAPLGEPLPADGGPVMTACRSYVNALKSGDPGTIRKFTMSDFGKNFSRPEMRILLPNLKNTIRDDISVLSGFSNGSIATLFVKPSGSDDASEMGIVKLVFVNNEWRVSADIFTKFY